MNISRISTWKLIRFELWKCYTRNDCFECICFDTKRKMRRRVRERVKRGQLLLVSSSLHTQSQIWIIISGNCENESNRALMSFVWLTVSMHISGYFAFIITTVIGVVVGVAGAGAAAVGDQISMHICRFSPLFISKSTVALIFCTLGWRVRLLLTTSSTSTIKRRCDVTSNIFQNIETNFFFSAVMILFHCCFYCCLRHCRSHRRTPIYWINVVCQERARTQVDKSSGVYRTFWWLSHERHMQIFD